LVLDLGPSEILFILVLILVLFGPDKLPELARRLGKYYRQLNEYKRFLDEEIRKGFLEADESSKKKPSGKRVSGVNKAGVDEDLASIAISLGIDTKGKSREELVKEIREAIVKRDSGGEPGVDVDEAVKDD